MAEQFDSSFIFSHVYSLLMEDHAVVEGGPIGHGNTLEIMKLYNEKEDIVVREENCRR